MSASAFVVVMGASPRAFTIVRAMARANGAPRRARRECWRGLPRPSALTTSAAGRAVLRHAHVERAVAQVKEKPRSGVVELHGGDADIEHDTVDAGEAGVLGRFRHVAEFVRDQDQPVAEFLL